MAIQGPRDEERSMYQLYRTISQNLVNPGASSTHLELELGMVISGPRVQRTHTNVQADYCAPYASVEEGVDGDGEMRPSPLSPERPPVGDP